MAKTLSSVEISVEILRNMGCMKDLVEVASWLLGRGLVEGKMNEGVLNRDDSLELANLILPFFSSLQQALLPENASGDILERGSTEPNTITKPDIIKELEPGGVIWNQYAPQLAGVSSMIIALHRNLSPSFRSSGNFVWFALLHATSDNQQEMMINGWIFVKNPAILCLVTVYSRNTDVIET